MQYAKVNLGLQLPPEWISPSSAHGIISDIFTPVYQIAGWVFIETVSSGDWR